MTTDLIHGAEDGRDFKLGLPASPFGKLRHRTSLRFDVVVAFVIVNLLLVTACLIALRQNVALHREVSSKVALLTPRSGLRAPSLTGADWTGTQRTITYGQESIPTLIYSFSQECPFCEANWVAMRSLQGMAPRSLRIVYVDTVGDRFNQDYLRSKGIGQSILLVSLSQDSELAYSARLMPQTLLVDAAGRVQWAHIGGLSPDDVSKAMSFIKPEHN